MPDPNPLDHPDRLASLAATGLLNSEPDAAFDRLTHLARQVVSVPVALVSLVDDQRQFFKSACGLPEPWATSRQTPLSHSFCQHVVTSSEPLVVSDARADPRLCDNLAVSELGVAAYLGCPITGPAGHILGSFCVVDTRPRDWSDSDITTVTDLAGLASSEIELRGARKASLRDSERLHLLLDSAGEGIYGIDRQGNCNFCNPVCLELLGYQSTVEFLGHNMHQLIHHTRPDGTPYPEHDCAIFKAFGNGGVTHVDDEVFWRKDGSSIPVEYRSSPIRRNAEIIGAVVTFADISERNRNRKELAEALENAERSRRLAERADREKSRFLANMSHEIRTPMNAVIGFAELLAPLVPTPKAQRYLDAIRSSGSSLLELINDILDLSKIESGNFQLSTEPCDVRQLASSIRLLFEQLAARSGIELVVDVASAVPPRLLLDPTRTRQLLVNLVGNAVKFTTEGSVLVTFTAAPDDRPSGPLTLEVTVTDTGPGIAPEDLETIFQPFRQGTLRPGTSHDTQAEPGTGLGLSISKSIAELAGGQLTVTSTLGEGSTFTTTIPTTAASGQTGDPAASGLDSIDFDDFQPASILVVDDNALNRDLLGGYFDRTAHTVHFAADGAEAIARARELRPHLILMDIRMPNMSGTEAQSVLARDPDLREVPVIAVTASSMKRQEGKLRRTFSGYIRKPVSAREIYAELSKFLTRKSASPAGRAPPSTTQDPAPDTATTAAWRALLPRLRELESDTWAAAASTHAIGAICRFADQLRELGAPSRCTPLIDYATRLHHEADTLQLIDLTSTLAHFPELVTNIDALTKDTPKPP